MTELMKRYEKETGKPSMRCVTDGIHCVGIDIWHYEYIAWLENKVLDGKTIEKFQEIITNQCDEISSLKAQLTWRPVSEKPKEGQIVFVMVSTGWVVAQYLDGGFYVDDGFTFGDFINGVSHWLPIPPAPEGEVK